MTGFLELFVFICINIT